MATPILKHLVQLNAFDNIVGVEGPLSQVESLSVSAAGTPSTVAAVSSIQSLLPRDTVIVTVAAGSGAYTKIVALSASNHLAGDEVVAVVTLPASANPTVVFRNATSTGTVLLTVTNSGAAVSKVGARFVFNGTAWVLANANVVASAVTGST